MTTGDTATTGRDTGIAINGYAVKEFRKMTGITAKQLADQAGVGRPYITLIENGHRNKVSPPVFKAIVAALCVNRRALLVNPYAHADEVAA